MRELKNIDKKNKFKLSKRHVLYIVDAVLFVVMALLCLFNSAMEHKYFYEFIPSYILIYLAFVVATVIIYYLSIMASALSHAYLEKEKEEDENQK